MVRAKFKIGFGGLRMEVKFAPADELSKRRVLLEYDGTLPVWMVGSEDRSAVLCTEEKTFKMNQIELSNVELLMDENEVKCMTKVKLAVSSQTSAALPRYPNGPQTVDELASKIQLSRQELEENKVNVLSNAWVDDALICKSLTQLQDSLALRGNIPKGELLEDVERHGADVKLAAHCLEHFGYPLDVVRVARMQAKMLFRQKRSWAMANFIDAWRSLCPDCELLYLKGMALISDDYQSISARKK